MGAITNQALAGLTVEYNGVQFGGADSEYGSTPPQYRFAGSFVYDDAGISVVRTRYIMSVSCIFHENSEGAMAASAAAIQEKLSRAGQSLSIEGLGTGFGVVLGSDIGDTIDVLWGPKPISFDWAPIGQLAWECNWVVEFNVVPCADSNGTPGAFTAFNFDTTWANDFEGLCERTIAGYVEIAVSRNVGGGGLAKIADDVRDNINIVIPLGFRRVRNVWRENAAHNRLDFVVTDEVMPGEALPPYCISAVGDLSY